MANQVLWGFHNLADAFSERVTEVGVGVIDTAIAEVEAEHNRQINTLMSLFAEPTTEFKTRFRTMSGTGSLQPVDENGRVRPRRTTGYYDLGFPLHMAGDAWGANYLTMQTMTVADVNRLLTTITINDTRWMRYHILAALFASTSWTFSDDEHGSLTVQGMANGDSTVYQIRSGMDNGATDNHYLGQADAIDDAHDPFPTIYDELTEHPENSGQVIALVPTNLVTSIKALAGFYRESDPNLRQGSGVTELIGSISLSTPGKLLGYHDAGVWIFEWANLPDSRIIGMMTGGERPLKMRQHPAPALQGFRQIAEREDYPWYERQWLRHAGFGGWNRVGALVMEIGDASYDVPTGYESPMA